MQEAEYNEDEKLRITINRMQSIANSTIKDFNPTFIEWNKREYNISNNAMMFVAQDIQDMTDRQIMGEVLHNIGHALYTTMPSNLPKIPEPRRKFFLLVNTIEDIRMEEQMIKYYPWVYDNFLYKFRKQYSEISNSIEEKLSPDTQYLYALICRYWWYNVENLSFSVSKILAETKETVEEAYTKKTMDELISYLIDSLWPIFQRLLQEWESEVGKWNEEDKQLKSKSEKALCMDTLMKDMKDMSKDKLEERKKQDSQEQLDQYEKEEFWEDVDNESDDTDKPIGNDPVLWEQKEVVESTLANKENMNYEQMYKEIMPLIPFFVKKLGSIIEDNKYSRWWWNYRSWKLNTKKLYKWKCGSDRLFSKKIERKNKDCIISLLVDESWSMTSEEKNRNAAKATSLLSEVLSKIGVTFSINWFNTSNRCYKKFNEKFSWKHRRQIERIILETYWYGSWWNNDGYSVNKAVYDLMRQWDRESNRLLIVLSDWLPTPWYWDVPTEDKKRLPSSKWKYSDFNLGYEISKWSNSVMIIGIGIKSPHVAIYYKNNVLVNSISDLPLVLLNQLKKKIKRW